MFVGTPPHAHTLNADAPVVLFQAVKTLYKIRRVTLAGHTQSARAHGRDLPQVVLERELSLSVCRTQKLPP